MPARTIRCRQVRNVGGTIYARFSDKTEVEFKSRIDMRAFIAKTLTDDVMKALILAKVFEDASDGTPLSQCDNLRATLDFAAVPMLSIVSATT